MRTLIRFQCIAAGLSAALFVSGCGNLSGIPGASANQTCPLPQGKGCRSITEVYRGATPQATAPQSAPAGDQGPSLRDGSPSRATYWTVATSPGGGAAQASGFTRAPDSMSTLVAVADRPTPSTGAPLRSPPRMLRIWMAPYEENDGALRDQSYTYVMIDSGRWHLEHNQRRIMNAFAPTKGPREAPKVSDAPSAPRIGLATSPEPSRINPRMPDALQSVREMIPAAAPASLATPAPDSAPAEASQ